MSAKKQEKAEDRIIRDKIEASKSDERLLE
jgi:hypothetical protein